MAKANVAQTTMFYAYYFGECMRLYDVFYLPHTYCSFCRLGGEAGRVGGGGGGSQFRYIKYLLVVEVKSLIKNH